MYDDYFMQFFFKKPNMTSCYLKKLFCGNTFYKKTYRCNIHIHFFDMSTLKEITQLAM